MPRDPVDTLGCVLKPTRRTFRHFQGATAHCHFAPRSGNGPRERSRGSSRTCRTCRRHFPSPKIRRNVLLPPPAPAYLVHNADVCADRIIGGSIMHIQLIQSTIDLAVEDQASRLVQRHRYTDCIILPPPSPYRSFSFLSNTRTCANARTVHCALICRNPRLSLRLSLFFLAR